MKRIEKCTTELAEALGACKEYQEYVRIRDKVAENPELRREINAFRIHNFRVQNSPEVPDVYEAMDRMAREYEEFRKNPLVDEYLKCELQICRTIQKIVTQLVQAVDLDTQSFAEELA